MTKTQKSHKLCEQEIAEFRGKLLAWYDQNRRVLPWRAEKGETPEPYHVWLSEIMLQQTTVGAVQPYFTKFLQKWPNVHALASAHNDDVMHEWAGLGYYARARNLHKCAKVVSQDMGGVFPQTQTELKSLPGIGEYTSAAIMTIAFNKPAVVMDGNVERVLARYYAVQTPLPTAKKELFDITRYFFETYGDRPGDLAQAFMDLGATICIAKTPRCGSCPLSDECRAKTAGLESELPRKEKKKKKPQKAGYVYWITNEKEQVLLHRRPDNGLLGGMLALPTSEWVTKQSELREIVIHENLKLEAINENHSIHHGFTHFDLELVLKSSVINEKQIGQGDGYSWYNINDVKPSGFPTVFKKAVKVFMANR